ncbi:hypothetical protein GCM10020000_16630 [Streptomyces olivoverticillatus]
MKPKTPRLVQGPKVRPVGGQRAAPKADVHMGLGACHGLFDVQVRHGRGGRQAVERHVDERGDASGGRGAGGGVEALPLGAAGVVHMDVRVDEAGEQRVIPEVRHGRSGRRLRRVRQQGRDPASGDGDGGGAHALRRHDPSRAQQQLHLGHGRPFPPAAGRKRFQRSVEWRCPQFSHTPRARQGPFANRKAYFTQ